MQIYGNISNLPDFAQNKVYVEKKKTTREEAVSHHLCSEQTKKRIANERSRFG